MNKGNLTFGSQRYV